MLCNRDLACVNQHSFTEVNRAILIYAENLAFQIHYDPKTQTVSYPG